MLEEELGQKLFIHRGKKTVLTREGRLLKVRVDKILAIEDSIYSEFASLAEKNRIIRLATPGSFCTFHLPRVIGRFMMEHKDVNIELYARNTNEVISGVNTNEFDVGIISGYVDIAGLECKLFDRTRVDLIVSSTLADAYKLEEIVKKFPFFKYKVDAVQYSLDLEKTLKECNIRPVRIIDMESILSITELVKMGLGYTVITDDNVWGMLEPGGLKIITPENVNIYADTSFICLKDSLQRPEIRSFMDLLKSTWHREQMDE